MPLIINGERVHRVIDVEKFAKKYHAFKEQSKSLLSQAVKEVGPQGLLYIGQGELAATSPHDDVISILGSEDATTCHIAVVRHTGSGATALVHFDGRSISEGLAAMIDQVLLLTGSDQRGRLEVHLVGGFLDERRNSHEVSDKVLSALCDSSHELHLVTACITHFNTEYRNSIPFPVIYGIAIDVKSGEVFRATFPDKGPDLALRGARVFTGGKENIRIYNPQTHLLEIGPFNYGQIPNVEMFLSLSDANIRNCLSTSPLQEPESFAASVRCSLTQLRDFPHPLKSMFADGQPRQYEKDKRSGMWNRQT